ncbi:MAG: hypothetical protein KDD61_06010 [Bdellovibrionales bacterium]|nr:hypothetical protein [Bdellovibrionales bacterium]
MKMGIIYFLLFTFGATATPQKELSKELYLSHTEPQILLGERFRCHPDHTLSCEEQEGLTLTLLERLEQDGHVKIVDNFIKDLSEKKLHLSSWLRLFDLVKRQHPGSTLLKNITMQIERRLKKQTHFSKQESTTLCLLWDTRFCSKSQKATITFPTTEQVRDLYHSLADLSNYQNGTYQDQPRFFMFCRKTRKFPCLMVAKDRYGRPFLNKDGSTWTLPTLALSRHGKKFNEFNGNTPAGIFTIDGVMPKADNRFVFGKFRRLILDFLPATEDEMLQKSFLPKSHANATWWNEATVARDLGRGLFRIHGTGLMNVDRSSPYYTFYATSGCIATRENTYDNVNYKDQRHLLDSAMTASNLDPIYSNEVKIKGVLYVININNEQRQIEFSDLSPFGIE